MLRMININPCCQALERDFDSSAITGELIDSVYFPLVVYGSTGGRWMGAKYSCLLVGPLPAKVLITPSEVISLSRELSRAEINMAPSFRIHMFSGSAICAM